MKCLKCGEQLLPTGVCSNLLWRCRKNVRKSNTKRK